MSNSHTPEQANQLWCPMTRLSDTGTTYNRNASAMCIADRCAMWRWEHTTASVPTTTTGAGGDPARTFEIRTVRTHGFCGMGGNHD